MLKKTATDSPFAQTGASLVDNGYSAIPILPGSKRPGKRIYGEWYGENDWQRYGDRLPTEIEVGHWCGWEDAGVCVVLDDRLKVVDIDTDDAEIVAAIVAVLPPATVKKRGQKGYSAFYRGSADIVSLPLNLVRDGVTFRAVDLLAKGRQTILPPTVHPDTDTPYVWLTPETLADVSVDELPELPDDIAERLTAALEPFGLVEIAEKRAFVDVESGDSVWREIKDLAFANMDLWVPHLGTSICKKQYGGGYRTNAEWRGGDGANVSFHHTGIKDMAHDITMSPIDVVMRSLSMRDADALQWLKDRLGYVEPWLPSIDYRKLIVNGLAKRSTVITPEQANIHADVPEPAFVPPATPKRLADVPGLVGDITEWLESTARNPSPILNLGAALAFVGALAGRRYEGPTGLRTNVYVIGLAASGFGKEHPRAGIKSIATATNILSKFFGGNKIASSSGLRNRVKKSPSLVYMIDEFGGFMRKVTSPKSGNHEKEIAEDLLEMTGTASSVFMGADYAQSLAEPIHNPNVCIFGTSTPDAFWKALGSGSIADGFIPRFIILDAGKERPTPRDPESNVNKVPDWLKVRIQEFVAHKNGGNLNGMLSDGSTAVVPILATWGDGAKRVFDKFVDEMFRAMDAAPVEQEPVYARVAENAMRIATIVAAGADPTHPSISAEIMTWATEIAFRSSQMLLEQAERYVADNDRQAEYKRVRSIIGDGKKAGMRRSYLAKRINGVVDKRRLGDIVDMLIDAEEVVDVIIAPPNGGKKSSVLYLSKYAPKPDGDAE